MTRESGDLSPDVVREASMAPRERPGDAIPWRERPALRLALNVLLVGLVCEVSTEYGFAIKFPPHYISPLWPTGAILFGVLVATPPRHWWAYTLAAYFTSVLRNVWQGLPVSSVLFVVAGITEYLIDAVAVRRLAGGLRVFDSLRGLVVYICTAVLLAPLISSFVAVASTTDNYWFYWRAWFLAEATAFVMLAPALLTWIAVARTRLKGVALARVFEAGLIGCALLAISVRVFIGPTAAQGSIPALVYLPLPLLLWAAVRFGPAGVSTCLLMVALVSISGAVRGLGPFAGIRTADSVLSLQLFLITMAIPLMFLATLTEERREKDAALGERVKELTLLHQTASLLQENRRFDEDQLRQLVVLLPSAWQYPEVCEARIRYASLEARTSGWRESDWQQAESFTTRDGRTGAIAVEYGEPRPPEIEGPFLLEERRLLQSLARMLATHLDRQLAEQATRTLSGRLVSAQEEERRNVARELHDEIGQVLTVVKMNLESLREPTRLAHAQSGVDTCVQNVDRAIHQVRALALDLRPAILDHLGLSAALRWFVDRMPVGKPSTHLAMEELDGLALSPEVRMAAFRITQEAVTNVLRHAGARNIWLTVAARPAGLELSVRDDGQGFDLAGLRRSPAATFGLSSMEERVRLVGGQIEIRTSPGAGTEVWATFPLLAA
jgi:signal transduction histidine kinase